MWAYFETTEYNRPWMMKRTKSKRLTDRDIRCIYIDEQTGIRCNWRTTDSARHTSTSKWQDIWRSIQSTLPTLTLELQAQRSSLLSLPDILNTS
ncbi:hypothetical protein POJ06DRAFT_255630 [Lipomyces tetrasporus]|uniref:Uncharacterized protein n=1 Tax=Lipomyces tetrasporus TaxID=54092 RepID=A0AAD7QRV2_9ASCO|nr:uncharacterized protein POJ06DRAFT_255630 [Lipomyces tetrasporus]KAJ8100173.1 hypothetical protein POJ06DRAFT_255630 [Lipomyces tetrasporus]